MEVSAEAKRIMVVALGKLYSSRTQRGGLRLHRSLLLTLVMKSARDMYHAAQAGAESVEAGCEQEHCAGAVTTEPAGAPAELQGPASSAAGQQEEVVRPPAELRENKENVCPSGPVQHSRKRRGKAAVEPDFLPCKKAKLEQGLSPPQLIVNSVLMDYVNCSSELGAPQPPCLYTQPLQRVETIDKSVVEALRDLTFRASQWAWFSSGSNLRDCASQKSQKRASEQVGACSRNHGSSPAGASQ